MLDLEPKTEGILSLIVGAFLFFWIPIIGIIVIIWGIYNLYKAFKGNQ